MKKNMGLKITAELQKNDGTIVRLSSTNKTRVLRWALVQKFKVAYLRVGYGGGLSNEGNYFDYDHFKMALDAFTERGLNDRSK